MVGQAQTGTGKTAAFGIPIVERLDPSVRTVQALVLAPTRELAMQVTEELRRLGQFRGLKVVACYGGQPIARQITSLGQGAHIVVGTPGRVLDHLGRGTVSFDRASTVVLDEADAMLDIGFLPDVERILNTTPRDRQTALFSATIPDPIRRIVRRYMHDPAWVQIGGEIETVPEVRQVYYEVWEHDRLDALREILDTNVNGGKALLFRRTQVGVDKLVRWLQRERIAVAGIHGGMTQSQRTGVMAAFKRGDLKVLVATNVAARGLDIPEVSHVVNFDMPDNIEEYVHRIGRTARMGRDGTAITLVTEWSFDMLDALQKHLRGAMERRDLALYAAAAVAR